MARRHIWRIKKEYFYQLKSGRKTLEIRVGYPFVKIVKKGDTITFENYGPNEFEVLRISTYDSLEKMLETEGPDDVFPGITTFDEALRKLRDIYPKHKEALGVYVLELKLKTPPFAPPTPKFLQASDLLKKGENKTFSKLIAESYMITDGVLKDYPKHCRPFLR